jgi:hypothetical protein
MGPWSRSFVAAVAGRAERPDLEVGALRVDPGTIWAVVEGCEVTLGALVIPPRIWASMARYAKGMGQLEDAVEGKMQSVHLEHLLQEDWGEMLIPRASAIARSCTCEEAGDCEHVDAVAYAFGNEIDKTPRVLLLWRGVAGIEKDDSAPTDPWKGKRIGPDGSAIGRFPRGAVMKRLGASEVRLSGGEDLGDALRSAYDALTCRGPTKRN